MPRSSIVEEIRGLFQNGSFLNALKLRALHVNRLKIYAWDSTKEIAIGFQLLGEGRDLIPDQLREIFVLAGMHMINFLELFMWIKMHEPQFCNSIYRRC